MSFSSNGTSSPRKGKAESEATGSIPAGCVYNLPIKRKKTLCFNNFSNNVLVKDF